MGTVVHLKRRREPDRVDACSDCRHRTDGATEWACGALAVSCSTVRQQLRGTPCPHFAAKPPTFWQRLWQAWESYRDRY